MRPHARQPGQLVIELRQVHLAHTRHRMMAAQTLFVQRITSGQSLSASAEQACTCS